MQYPRIPCFSSSRSSLSQNSLHSRNIHVCQTEILCLYEHFVEEKYLWSLYEDWRLCVFLQLIFCEPSGCSGSTTVFERRVHWFRFTNNFAFTSPKSDLPVLTLSHIYTADFGISQDLRARGRSWLPTEVTDRDVVSILRDASRRSWIKAIDMSGYCGIPMPAPSVPTPRGLEAIYSTLRQIYPDQPNPLQVTALVKYWWVFI